MPDCQCCGRKEVPTKWELCPDCQERVKQGTSIWVNHTCPECHLTWCGYFSPDKTPEHHSKLSCMQIQTKKIDPDTSHGHITLRCSSCGLEGWSTKNIDFIGARNITWQGKGKECSCSSQYLEPVLTHPEKYEQEGQPICISNSTNHENTTG